MKAKQIASARELQERPVQLRADVGLPAVNRAAERAGEVWAWREYTAQRPSRKQSMDRGGHETYGVLEMWVLRYSPF